MAEIRTATITNFAAPVYVLTTATSIAAFPTLAVINGAVTIRVTLSGPKPAGIAITAIF